ncbi:MAG: VOC family protein [Chloroflexota bacterium]|nr:VOC family protein [Chloroflexota bacterium]
MNAPIHPQTQLGIVSLTVSDLARSLDFYTRTLGMDILAQTDHGATVGVAASSLALLELVELPGAKPQPQFSTGLYHVAILLPSRADLGRWLLHMAADGYPLQGASDHRVSEAVYLADPDENGLEIYRDRPRAEWVWRANNVEMATLPMDIDGVLDAGRAASRDSAVWQMPAGTTVGHIHLRVGDIARAQAFYHDLLGFDIVMQMPSALFVSAGGYHHHIGANTWGSRGAPPSPAGTVGLGAFTIRVPDAAALHAITARLDSAAANYTADGDDVRLDDPFQNAIRIVVA